MMRVGRQSAKASSGSPTLGPVADLEKHLPAEWWRTIFNATYLKTDGDVVENAVNTAHEVDLLVSAAGLNRRDRVLDLCCGQGRHCLELARRGFKHLVGIDQSDYLIKLARQRARRTGLRVDFRKNDARRLQLRDQFDCIALMGNSFGYFENQSDDAALLEVVHSALRPGGTLALDLTDGDWLRQRYDKRSWEWIDADNLVCRERSLSSCGTRLVCREVVVGAREGVLVDQFYAERLYTAESVRELLARVGFVEFQDHGQLATASDRNQDLGMMAHRMFITARRPGRAGRSRPTLATAKPLFRDVTVLLGDAGQPDPVKRNGKFNAEDQETVVRLKAALAELKEYRFRYIGDHANWLREWSQHPPAFVLNFCDEGYHNNPAMEAHVAAVLEMLRTPYSGAGPSCLAVCFNKSYVRSIAMGAGIPVPDERYFGVDDPGPVNAVSFPVLVKPNCGDGSLGITTAAVTRTAAELAHRLSSLREQLPGRALLAQEFLEGPEYTVGVIGNPASGCEVLPVLEVDYSRLDPTLPKILGYESKWHPESPYWTDISYRAAQLPRKTLKQLTAAALLLFERLECRDYARFDFRADRHGVIKLLEVNPNPGWCWDGKLNLMAGLAGLSYPALLRRIIQSAQGRIDASGAARR